MQFFFHSFTKNIKNDLENQNSIKFFLIVNSFLIQVEERGYEEHIVNALAETSDEGRSWVR